MKEKTTRRAFLTRKFVGALAAFAVVGRPEQVTVVPLLCPEFRSLSDLDAVLRELGWRPS